MAAPATTARSTPVGTKIGDGYQTLIASATDPDVSFWEKGVQPPGLDGGEKVDNTTMHNTTVRTYSARSLIEMTDASTTAAYDPVVLDQIIALINVEGAWTIHHPNGDTWDFYGYLKSFVPTKNEEGTQPEAEITIVPTNVDPSDGSEAVPNYKTSSGTD